MAWSQLSMRPSSPLWLDAPCVEVRLLNEGHLVDFAQRGEASAHFAQRRIAQELHAGIARGALDFGSGPAIDDHFANVVGEIEKFGDRRAATIAAAGAFQAAIPFHEF